MKFFHVRFTIRRLMIAVGAVAVVIWGMASRWRLYRVRAEHHATEQTGLRAQLTPALEFKREFGFFPGCGGARVYLETECERAEWHARLKVKYQRASLRPWLQVEPDPPPPE